MIQQPERLGRRTRSWLWLAAWPLALGVVVAVALVGSRETAIPAALDGPATAAPPAPPAASSRPAATPRGGHVTATGIAPGPMVLVAGHGRIWVASSSDATVRGLDPLTGRVEITGRMAPTNDHEPDRAAYPVARPDNGPPVLAVAAGSVWAAGVPRRTDLVRVDPGTGRVLAQFAIGGGVAGLLGNGGALWVVTDAGTLVRIDPATNRATSSIVVGRLPVYAALGPTALWVSTAGRVVRHDPVDGRSLGEVTGGGGPIGLRGATVWARSPGAVGPALVAIDEATGRVVERADIATSGRGELAWSLPALEAVDLADDRTLYAPRLAQILVIGEMTWLVRSDLAEVWRIEAR